jgi:hypothetical protein
MDCVERPFYIELQKRRYTATSSRFRGHFYHYSYAKSVDLSRLLPIWPSGRSCFTFAALIINRAKAALRTLPTALSKKIGRQAPGVAF